MKKIVIGKSAIHGEGLFAEEPIKKGDKIQIIPGPKTRFIPKNSTDSEQIMNWIGIGKTLWIDTRGTIFNFINHSCDANAAIAGTRTLYALRAIKKGEEIFIDYSMTDSDPHWSFPCNCGVGTCRQEVRAIYTVPKEVFKKHMPYVPRYFQRVYLRNYVKTGIASRSANSKVKQKK